MKRRVSTYKDNYKCLLAAKPNIKSSICIALQNSSFVQRQTGHINVQSAPVGLKPGQYLIQTFSTKGQILYQIQWTKVKSPDCAIRTSDFAIAKHINILKYKVFLIVSIVIAVIKYELNPWMQTISPDIVDMGVFFALKNAKTSQVFWCFLQLYRHEKYDKSMCFMFRNQDMTVFLTRFASMTRSL